MKCDTCKLRDRKKCQLTTDDIERIRVENMRLLEAVCKASVPRFVDEEHLLDNFRGHLDMFYDMAALLYAIPRQEYVPAADAKEDQNAFAEYQSIKKMTYDQCASQADMRILTLGHVSCGFVGEYSSGKSSYLNKEIFGNNLLPVNVDKTTSIPTYVFWGRKNMLVYENMQGNILTSEGMESLKVLSHSSKPEGCPCSFPWNAVMKRIFCFASNLQINSRDIVYVDLPGYSATADDDAAMLEASRGCDKIVYFKPVQSGGLIEKELEYLKKLNRRDIMVVLSKADKKSPGDCRKTLEEVKKTLKEKEIEVKDVILYSIYPEKFAGDKKFSAELNQYHKKLKKFVTDASAVDKDLDYAVGMVNEYMNEFQKWAEENISYINFIEKTMSDFIGDKPLDQSFWKEWDNINKNVASSSKDYIDMHIFSANTVRTGSYLSVHQDRMTTYFNSDHYNSLFNYAYKEAVFYISWSHLLLTALGMENRKEAADNYGSIQDVIQKLHTDYDKIREMLDMLVHEYNDSTGRLKYMYQVIPEDTKVVCKGLIHAYSELINYAKEYEQRWY